jgi:hypothetical protein
MCCAGQHLGLLSRAYKHMYGFASALAANASVAVWSGYEPALVLQSGGF